MTDQARLGVIGGSGVYQMQGVEVVREHALKTPFGEPSDAVVEGKVEGTTIFFLPRHGKGHRLLPTEVPYRANIHALKQLGVTHVMAVSACGIMKDDIRPGDMVVPDQLFDRTKGVRASTFFGEGIVGHVTFADPFCDELRQVILAAARLEKARVHDGGSYVCMEGPQFSTRAESHQYRATLSPAVIGMTALPEAKLAREAEMGYGMLALATDYDCWHETEDDVSVEAVMAVLKANAELANAIVKRVAKTMPEVLACSCRSAAKYAIMTRPDLIPLATRAKVALLYDAYLSPVSVTAVALALGVAAMPTNLGVAPTSPAEAHRAARSEVSLALSANADERQVDLGLAGSATPSIAVAASTRASRLSDGPRTFARTSFGGSFKVMDRFVLGGGASLEPNGERTAQYGALVKEGDMELGVAQDGVPYLHGRIGFLHAFVLAGSVTEDGSGTVFTAWTHALTSGLSTSVGIGYRRAATAALSFAATL